MITKKYVNTIAYQIVGCAIEVHSLLGPGLLESVYEICLIQELEEKDFHVKRQVPVPIIYKGKELPKILVLDLLINDLIILEIKAVDMLQPIFNAQLLSYLYLTGKPKGLLMNFHVEKMVNGVIPLVTKDFAKLPES